MARIEKAFVSDDGVAIIRCPYCSVARKVSVEKFRGKKHTVKLRCSCQKSFVTQLDFRKNYRKMTDLQGTYRITSSVAAGGGPMKVTNLSMSGIGFSVSGVHNIKVGQTAHVDFVLDNRKSTRINKEVVIKTVNANHIGCEFVSHQAFEKDFGFYLQP